MGRVRFPLLTLVTTTTFISLGAIAPPPLALAPEAVEHPILDALEDTPSLVTLRRLQRQATEALGRVMVPSFSQDMATLTPYLTWSQIAFRVQQQLLWEEAAAARYTLAEELALQAEAALRRNPNGPSPNDLTVADDLWTAALRELSLIAPSSSWVARAEAKEQDFYEQRAAVRSQLAELQSKFLEDIAAQSPNPEAIHITLCHISGSCRHYQGDIPPASPASLIKLPIAVALMDKVEADGIDLDSQTYVEEYNWTENADGSTIFVEEEYSLRELMVAMIRESNNIATNHLVDYLGWETLNTLLAERGFPNIQVHTKLAGDRTLPRVNSDSGGGTNTLTTNEVTEMMRQIYTFQRPGDGEILDALITQQDQEFGYTALQELRSPRVAWIGEKTGQNSRVIGTILAVRIDAERYFMTVAIDNSAEVGLLHRLIQAVVSHILTEGHWVPQTPPALAP